MSLPATVAQLANRALYHLGKPPIADMSESSEQARVMGGLYANVVRAELRLHAWSFAMRRDMLAALSEAPKFAYGKQFQLPADFLRLIVIDEMWVDTSTREVGDVVLPVYTIEGRRLLANLNAPLPIRYIADVTDDLSLFDPLFFECAALKMAYAAAPSLVRNEARMKTLKQDYAQALFDAKRLNAIELPPREMIDGSWGMARVW